MPYVVSADGKSWRWVEPKDVPEGARVTNEKPTDPIPDVSADPIAELGDLIRALITKGVIRKSDIDRGG